MAKSGHDVQIPPFPTIIRNELIGKSEEHSY
jgi:hypothetical protein